MILTEIKIFPSKVDTKFLDVIRDIVKKRGTRYFEGGQATVIDMESHVWRVWFNDPGYERFLTYLNSKVGNPHLPRVLSKVRKESVQFKGMPKGMSVKYVKLEKLTEAPISAFTDAVDTVYHSNLIKLPSTVTELAELSLKLKVPADSDVEALEVKAEISRHPEFFKLVIELVNNHQANDLTSGNVMFRGAVPVITDPFKD